MESAFENYKLPKTKMTNKRQLLLKPIVDEITKEREACNWKYKVDNVWRKHSKDVARVVGIKIAHLKQDVDLNYIHKTCLEYKRMGKGDYSRCFFGMLK